MFTKNDILYFFIVVIVAAILASSWAGMTHEPVPLQVPENRFPIVTFTPVPAPPPAMPTYTPQLVPGSYADTHRNSTDNGEFSPAPAPVVVTTLPLPAITTKPLPSSTPVATTTRCCNPLNATQEMVPAQQLGGGMQMAPLLITILMISLIVSCLIWVSLTGVATECLNGLEVRLQNRFENADSSMISGIIMVFIGLVVVIATMSIAPVIGNQIVAAQPPIGCVPC